MKLLVIIKRVEDPEIKIKIKGDNSDIDTDGMKYVVNPFDEIAVEEALRVRDANEGEVIVACVGPSETTHQIRTALAMGAARRLVLALGGVVRGSPEGDPLLVGLAGGVLRRAVGGGAGGVGAARE